jgi:hypothetical protein
MLAVGVNAFLETLRIRLQIPFLDRIAKLVLAQARLHAGILDDLSSLPISGGGGDGQVLYFFKRLVLELQSFLVFS